MSPWDVAVYGATAGGVICAIAAAEAGARTLLLEPGRHVGGMVSGGLGKTDMERQERVIGGHARRFFERAGAHYGEAVAWRFEPAVAERVFTQWLEDARVEVRYGAVRSAVEIADARISALELADGQHVGATVFVDASYEGDLLAAAGVSYALGRESRSLHGEALAGRQELLPGPHQFRASVAAAPSGALEPYLAPLERIGLPTEGDGKLQSYCYRLCLSTDPARSEPVPPPADYDPEHYALVAAYANALGDGVRPADFLGIGQLPGEKTDINSGGPISTNLLGASWAYPEGDEPTRHAIRRAHRDWTQGLLYFLGNDRAVPANLRRAVARLRLPRDEFTDTEGWPHQLYVREARRMRGEYVLTQHDLTGARRGKPDAIGVAGYNIDIREVQWVVCPISRFPDVFSELLVEGYLSVPVEPWEVPYRALVPQRGDCTNLLVSSAISASHVAFSSFRMEPQFMIAGQAAGVAAALAARDGRAVQDVDVAELQRILRERGAVLHTH